MAAVSTCRCCQLRCLPKRRSFFIYLRQRFLTTLPEKESSGDAVPVMLDRQATLDVAVLKELEKGTMKHKNHPGCMLKRKVGLPDKLESAVNAMMDKYPVKDLAVSAEKVRAYLWHRQPPAESEKLTRRMEEIEKALVKKVLSDRALGTSNDSALDGGLPEEQEASVAKQAVAALKKEVYHWKPFALTPYNCMVYLVARAAQNYAAAYRVLQEIQQHDTNFNPETMLDFGSGTGMNLWAANMLWKNLVEHYCCDVSMDVSTLARLLLQDANPQADMCFKGVYFKQNLPRNHKEEYDLVISSYSLLELPGRSSRLSVVENLWRKTGRYLVLIENGTLAGHKLIEEARIHALQISESEVDLMSGRVVAPCPHSLTCPRLSSASHHPCNFPVSYTPLERLSSSSKQQNGGVNELISYVVLRKEARNNQLDVTELKTADPTWPRVVRSPSMHHHRVHHRLCMPDGSLKQYVLTHAKHERNLYKVARATSWGDLLPLSPELANDSAKAETLEEDIGHPRADTAVGSSAALATAD